ncbi:B-cell receptor CD22-like isoform X2 [Arapaima gigas]
MDAGEMLNFCALTLVILPGALGVPGLRVLEGNEHKLFQQDDHCQKIITLLVAAVVGTIFITLFVSLGLFICFERRNTKSHSTEDDNGAGSQRTCTDPHSDTYESLDLRNISPDYDTIGGMCSAVRPTRSEPLTQNIYSCYHVNSRSLVKFSQEGKSATSHMNVKV